MIEVLRKCEFHQGPDDSLNISYYFIIGFCFGFIFTPPVLLGDRVFNGYLCGLLSLLFYLISIFFHEISHALVIRFMKLPIIAVEVGFSGGRVIISRNVGLQHADIWKRIVLSAAGPFSHFVAIVAIVLIYNQGYSSQLGFITVFWVSGLNLLISLNPLPQSDGWYLLCLTNRYFKRKRQMRKKTILV